MRPAALAGAFGAVLAAGALALTVESGSVGTRLVEKGTDPSAMPGTATDALRAEIHATVDAGLPPDDPKVWMLEEELDALEGLTEATAAPEPGVDLDAVASGGEHAADPRRPDESEGWDSGQVECEPVPRKLSIEDIEGATCFVEPRTGGGARYVAVTPDGTEHEIVFGDE